MTNNKWEDSKIEELLNRMPDIKDSRSKSEVLDRLKQDHRLQKPKKRPPKWIPAFVAVAALLLFSLLVPSMLRSNNQGIEESMATNGKSSTDRDMKSSQSDDHVILEDTEEEAASEDSAGESAEMETRNFSERESLASHILLPEELNRMRTFRIGLTYAADIIPVTFLIPEEQFTADFPKGEPSSVELYNRYASEIPEEELGFEDYHPYSGELSLENDMIIHQISEVYTYDMSTALLGVYYKSIDETFIDYDLFKTVDENGEFVEFDHVGMTEVKTLLKGKRPLPYYKYAMPTGEFYLIPDGGESFNTAEEALVAMKEVPNDFVKSLIPESIDFDVRVIDGGGVAVITFKEQVDLLQMNPEDATAMIEGFMLTAQNFHMLARLENVQQEKFGKYDLTANLPEPVAVNPFYLFHE